MDYSQMCKIYPSLVKEDPAYQIRANIGMGIFVLMEKTNKGWKRLDYKMVYDPELDVDWYNMIKNGKGNKDTLPTY